MNSDYTFEFQPEANRLTDAAADVTDFDPSATRVSNSYISHGLSDTANLVPHEFKIFALGPIFNTLEQISPMSLLSIWPRTREEAEGGGGESGGAGQGRAGRRAGQAQAQGEESLEEG